MFKTTFLKFKSTFTVATVYYYYYKRAALRISDHRFYIDIDVEPDKPQQFREQVIQ